MPVPFAVFAAAAATERGLRPVSTSPILRSRMQQPLSGKRQVGQGRGDPQLVHVLGQPAGELAEHSFRLCVSIPSCRTGSFRSSSNPPTRRKWFVPQGVVYDLSSGSIGLVLS